ncbi:MAG: hypothetical protein FJX74_00215 [Armatimonadetes bacterium]|nr:hypothetical protein [Armatimonadota bacterium]
MEQQARRLLPVFRSEAEEIEFWDTHDPDEYFGGPEVSLASLMESEQSDLLVNVRLEAGPGASPEWAPVAVHFTVGPLPHEAGYDPVPLFGEVLRGLDGYGLEYRRAVFHCGASGSLPPELTVGLIVASRAEAEGIASSLQARLSDGGHRRAKGGLKGRAKELADRVGSWLAARHARLISEEEAQSLLHP